jgi:putative MFS transporter
VEPVTPDTYIAAWEGVRGRVFVVNPCIQHLAIPAAALFSGLLLPPDRLDTAGWQWFALLPAIGGQAASYIRRQVPGSAQWLLPRGKPEEVQALLKKIDLNSDDSGTRGSQVRDSARERISPCTGTSFLGDPSRRRTLVLIVLNIFQVGQFYGLLSWLPTLLISEGFTILRRLRSP